MKKTAIALVALMASGVASAQSASVPEVNLSGISLRLGVAFPTDNRLRTFSENLSGLGLEFAQNTSLIKNGESYIAIDYVSKRIGEFGKGNFIPVTYNVRIYNGPADSAVTRRTYAFYGAGIAFADFNNSESVLIGRGGLGVQLSANNFIELTGTFSGSTNSVGALNTVGLYFGYRF
jgi:hypothetical protein